MDGGGTAGLPGSAALTLADGVVHLDPAAAVFEAMLEGWATQQRARFLKEGGTIKPRLELVRRFARFSGQYPWQWEPAEAEAFFASIGRSPAYDVVAEVPDHVADVLDFISDPRYGWPAGAWSGSVRRRGRSCTSGTRSRTWPSSRASRSAPADL